MIRKSVNILQTAAANNILYDRSLMHARLSACLWIFLRWISDPRLRRPSAISVRRQYLCGHKVWLLDVLLLWAQLSFSTGERRRFLCASIKQSMHSYPTNSAPLVILQLRLQPLRLLQHCFVVVFRVLFFIHASISSIRINVCLYLTISIQFDLQVRSQIIKNFHLCEIQSIDPLISK